jgi:hypothetical protein
LERHQTRSRSQSDWRDQAFYDHTRGISDRGWAWEALRRNREFGKAWGVSRSAFDVDRLDDRIAIIQAREDATAISAWGVIYSDAPSVNARDALVLWDAQFTKVLNAIALTGNSAAGFGSFRLGDLNCSTAVFCGPAGIQHVLHYGQGRELQLQVSGANILEPVHLLTDLVPQQTDTKTNLYALELFHELRAGRRPALSSATAARRADRLRMVLQALDGHLAHATLREIGVALFGATRVEKDWDDDHRHLKDRVRRAVARGQWMMNGGYLKYLK